MDGQVRVRTKIIAEASRRGIRKLMPAWLTMPAVCDPSALGLTAPQVSLGERCGLWTVGRGGVIVKVGTERLAKSWSVTLKGKQESIAIPAEWLSRPNRHHVLIEAAHAASRSPRRPGLPYCVASFAARLGVSERTVQRARVMTRRQFIHREQWVSIGKGIIVRARHCRSSTAPARGRRDGTIERQVQDRIVVASLTLNGTAKNVGGRSMTHAWWWPQVPKKEIDDVAALLAALERSDACVIRQPAAPAVMP